MAQMSCFYSRDHYVIDASQMHIVDIIIASQRGSHPGHFPMRLKRQGNSIAKSLLLASF